MKKYFIQNIDYTNNRYYNTVDVKSPFSDEDNIKVYELVNAIDSVIGFIVTTATGKNGLQIFHEHVDGYIAELKKILTEKSKDDTELRDTLMLIVDGALTLAEGYITNKTNNDDFKEPDYSSDPALRVIANKVALMKQQGYLEFEFPQSEDFKEWSTSQLEIARKKYENEEDWRGANGYDPQDKPSLIIQEFIKDNHIIEIISAYKKMNMSYFYAAWDYSHNRQKWFRNNHEYNHISPTNYYHIDTGEDVAKMLIYLTDVGAGDGPFKVVSGSNVHPRSTFLAYTSYVIDTQVSGKFGRKENLYGRGLFLYRKDLLLKFPKAFMGTTHFGDDLEEGSALSDYLLANTVTFERKKGSAVLFDGCDGIHAGGNADKGERLAVQVAFRRKRSFYKPVVVPLKQKVKTYIKSYLGK